MTVNELLQRLVELAARGRANWEVKMKHYDWHEHGDEGSVYDLDCRDDAKEVVIE